jgi:large subunit ribosomal protein L16
MGIVPKKLKYRKYFKGRKYGQTKGIATTNTSLIFGQYGLKAMESGWLKEKQIEAARRAISHLFEKEGKIWIRLVADKPVTSKGVEASMGGGKGDVAYYVCPVKAGRILFEVDGVKEQVAKKAMSLASYKLPIKTKFVKRTN